MTQSVLTEICDRMPTQEKNIAAAWAKQPAMAQELEQFLEQYRPVLMELGLNEADLAESYVGMVEDTLNARLEYMRTGAYCCKDFAAAQAAVYQDRRRMTAYMLGLALSYFLWGHHFAILAYYRETLRELPPQSRCLEIGSGHGLLAANLLERCPEWKTLDILDISPASLAMTRSILTRLAPDERRPDLSFLCGDIFETAVAARYDFITMGEVLEHVENPLALLSAVKRLLAPGGRFFVTTCVNSPAIDHIHQFRSVEEIRRMIREAGLTPVSERVLPSLDKSLEYMEKNQLDVSYAAVLEGK